MPLLQRLERGPRPVAGIELQQQAGNVVLHGPFGDRQQIRDLLVAVAGTDKVQDLAFANGQCFGCWLVCF